MHQTQISKNDNAKIVDANTKIVDANMEEYTVDGLKLKNKYIDYYKALKIIIDFIIMCVSKELSMKDYEQVYAMGRELYEILRSIFIDEPFKLWLENHADQFESKHKNEIVKKLEESLKKMLSNKTQLKSKTIKCIVTDMLNKELHEILLNKELNDDENDVKNCYIKPTCIVETYNCCNLTFNK